MANAAAEFSSPGFGFRRNDVLDAIFVVLHIHLGAVALDNRVLRTCNTDCLV